MRRIWLAIAVILLITATVVVGWAANLTVNGGTLQVFTFSLTPDESLSIDDGGNCQDGVCDGTESIPGDGENPGEHLPEEGSEKSRVPAAARPPPPLVPTTQYEVRPGDTLWDIAIRFGTTVQTLAQLNGLEEPAAILYGSTLNVPHVGEETESDLPREGPGEAGVPPAPRPSPPLIPTTEYKVKPGDTLWEIAARFGTTVGTLVELNGLGDPAAILYGSTLNVPYVGDQPRDVTADVAP